ncbi:glycosyltransferase family 2 protein [Fortiea contorta]|uniref:glycosyltransferase family 2 protein n=1 Tax=Fortiea contorta TaxID=1892405 RepID=UPI0003467879|nr:glycosyltransferase family 2 protein [Fortiea contorta]
MDSSIAVLITYYNEKELLTECLNSILKQSDIPEEILIYDDASPAPAENYIPHGYAIQVIRGKTNRGPAFGRNQLLKLSQSEYVHFQDTDDLFQPTWCQQVRSVIEASKRDIILTEISSYREGKLVSEKVMGIENLLNIGDLVQFGFTGSILVPSSTFRRELALKIGGYLTREILPQSEDFDFHIRLAATGATYMVIPEALIIQRLRLNSHSQNQKLCLTSTIKSIRLLSQQLPSKYLPDMAEASAKIGSQLFTINAYEEAREAFELACYFGRPKFLHRHRLYRLISKIINQETAEYYGVWYRRIVPNFLRDFIGKQIF